MIYRETAGRAKMHLRYVSNCSLPPHCEHHGSWSHYISANESHGPLHLVTANYVSKRNSRADRKSLSRAPELLRDCVLQVLFRFEPGQLRKINLCLKFSVRCSRKTLRRYFKCYSNWLYIAGKKLSQFTFSPSVFFHADIIPEEGAVKFLIKAGI